MIQEIYLIRALNIRKKFFQVTNRVYDYEKKLKELSKMIDETQNKLDDAVKLIDEQKVDTVDQAKDKFLKIILDLESDTSLNENYLKKIDDDVEVLRKEEIELYKELKENYPNLSDNEIKTEIQNYLKNFNLS